MREEIKVEITNRETGCVLAREALLADNFIARFKGLMGKSSLSPGREGLILYPCRAVHTMFMRFALDLAFVDGEGMVIRTVLHLPPNRSCSPCPGALCVLELPAGSLDATGTLPGHRLLFSAGPLSRKGSPLGEGQ